MPTFIHANEPNKDEPRPPLEADAEAELLYPSSVLWDGHALRLWPSSSTARTVNKPPQHQARDETQPVLPAEQVQNIGGYPVLISWSQENTAYCASCEQWPLLFTYGATPDKAAQNFAELLNDALDELATHMWPIPDPHYPTQAATPRWELIFLIALYSIPTALAVGVGIGLGAWWIALGLLTVIGALFVFDLLRARRLRQENKPIVKTKFCVNR